MTEPISNRWYHRISPRRRLGTRLLLWFFAVSIVPLIFIGLVGYTLSQKTGNTAAMKTVEYSFGQNLGMVNQYFKNIRLATTLFATHYVSTTMDQQEKFLTSMGAASFKVEGDSGQTPGFTGIKADLSREISTFSYLVALPRQQDSRGGFLQITFTTDSLVKILLSGKKLGQSYRAGLIDAGGMIVTGSPDLRGNNGSTYLGNEKVVLWTNWNMQPQTSGMVSDKVSLFTSDHGEEILGSVQPVEEMIQGGNRYALYQEIGPADAFGYSETINFIMIGLLIVIFVTVTLTALLVTSRIVRPVNQLSEWANQVALGNLQMVEIEPRKDEIGNMTRRFTEVVESFREITAVSESMAVGDFGKNVRVRSSYDRLGMSINQMLESFKGVIAQAIQISKGDFSGEIHPRGENDSLGIALRDMTRTLRENTLQIRNQDWLKGGMAELGIRLSGDQNLQDLTREAIGFLVKYLDAQLGLFYLREGEKELVLFASYAFHDRHGNFNRLTIGEGLAGQAAMERQPIYFTDIRNDAPALNYSVEEKIPPHYAIAPLVVDGELIGVIQIGSVNPFNDLHRKFFEQALDPLAVALNTSRSRFRVKQLLEQTQVQAERLQVQQEELQQTNEELEEQTRALKASEETLQAQQEELRVVNEELSERTRLLEEQRDNIRLKNQELEQAWKEIDIKARDLETASKYKSEFLANMSHELRTPLNSIIVLSQLLTENRPKNLSEKQLEFARTINSSGTDLLSLINEILDLSKIESGKIEINPEEFEVQHFLEQLTPLFHPLTEKKGLEFRVEALPGAPEHIFTDFQRLQQIMRNLLSNAFKFTQKGSITVSAGRPSAFPDIRHTQLSPEEAVVFRVSDTGIGIPADKMKVIFEAFQQADGTTSRRFGGTGLGLTISRSFAGILGGEIQVTSQEGKGSSFYLIIPIQCPATARSGHGQQPERPAQAPRPATTPTEKPVIRVADDRSNLVPGDQALLIVEDDLSFAQVLRDLAAEKGFKCLIAPDGETGLTLAAEHLPKAVILDIGLPDISGWEVLDRLKENPATRHIPVHFMSAYEKSTEALRLGAIGFLTKPVSIEKMNSAFRKIEEVISKPVKKLLVVEDDPAMQKGIVELIGNGDVKTTAVARGEEAFALLEKESFDCLILDLGLEDMSGFDLLEKIRKHKNIAYIPTIIYTGKELSRSEEEKLQRYADSIIIKGIRSPERLLAETTLFLHRVEASLPKDKQEMLRMIYNQEDVFTGKIILLVDDDSRNLFALSSVLEEKGIVVITAVNGRDGLDKLNDHPEVDLVLMDLMMPEMDGLESITNLRKDPRFENLPVIALTAKAMKEDREKCLEAGANDYLSKPVDNQKLLSLLRVWLHK